MSRRHSAVKRPAMPDPKFGDPVVSKFMSCLMYDGKRSAAEKIVYGAFDKIEERSGSEPIKVFQSALENVRPNIEVRAPAVLVVRLIRFRLRFALRAPRPWPSAG